MGVIIIEHAQERMQERGITEAEVREVLEAEESSQTELGRKLKEKVFDYGKRWQARMYPQKKVQVIYVEEEGKTVVITVYGFYGRWD